MPEFFAVEDGDNVATILQHHLGHPGFEDTDLRRTYEALERDLLRYCTRLRCQPDTRAHSTVSGGQRYQHPAHQLIGARDA